MKRCGLFVGLLILALVQTAPGQIEVGCRLATSRLLLFEPIRATIRVANNTGHPLHFGGDHPTARLGFVIEQAPGVPVPPTDRPLWDAPLTLAPGEEQELTVNLLPAYRIHSTGPYTIQIRAEWGEKAFLSQKAFLDVMPGLDVGRLAMGLPGASQDTRVFSLKTLTRDRMELLFLRVDDENSGQCLGVFDLGRIVRQFKPQMQSDGKGHLHVLHQSSPWKFTHTEINPDGIPVSSIDFSAYSTEVRFEKAPDGQVSVRGVQQPTDASLFLPPPPQMPAPAQGKKRR
jgi:hypothetical protein